MEDNFWVAKISNIYFGCLKFLIFFGVNSRCWARASLGPVVNFLAIFLMLIF